MYFVFSSSFLEMASSRDEPLEVVTKNADPNFFTAPKKNTMAEREDDNDEEEKTNTPLTTMFSAAKVGDCATLSQTVHSSNVNTVDSEGSTALHYAAQNGHVEATSLLLRTGASVNGVVASSKKKKPTPLHDACLAGATSTVKVLVNANADLLARDNIFQTPLHKAAEGGHPSTMTMLLGALTNQNLLHKGLTATDHNSQTPVMVAEDCLALEERRERMGESVVAAVGETPKWKDCLLLLEQASLCAMPYYYE